jgi:serine/threonine protein kinase/tetratricopeptide (TPR) repeat protein
MTPDRWQQLSDIYHAAVACSDGERAALLARLCSGDESLRREVESLIAQSNGDFLRTGDGAMLAAASAHLTGRQLGSYEIRSHLGSGGMGDVYEAYDPRLDRSVAIKVVRPDFSADAERRRRFEREARAAAALNHPNVVAVYDVGSQDATPYIVMEYVDGQTLRALLEKERLPLPRALEIGFEIADALSAAHGHGVVHRDLKPGNVMVTAAGRVKVLDFGLARTLERQPAAAATGAPTISVLATQAGRAMGTPGYMAPEQVLGGRGDHRADIFSLGVVLFELVTGRRPFDGSDLLTFGLNVLTRPAPAASELNPAVPLALGDLIGSTLARDPDSRPQSALDVRDRLDRLRGRVSPAKRRWAATAAILVGAAAVGLLVSITRPTTPTPSTVSTSVHSGPTRLAILPALDLSGRQDLSGWGLLIQSLLAGELTGLPDVGVLDPLSLNSRLPLSPPALDRDRPALPLLAAVRSAGASSVIHTRVVPASVGFDLRLSLVDVATGESRFSTSAAAARDVDLPDAVRALATSVVKYLQLQVLRAGADKDLAPWMSLRNRNIDAVKAFALANEMGYRFQINEVRPHLQRAIELDPSFIAPRVWYISALISRSEQAEAEKQYTELLNLKNAANPFEQAMIGFIGARLRGETESQIRYLETALAYSPANNILLINLATARAAAGDCRRALSDLDPPIQTRWDYPALYSLWGWCAIQEGRLDEARRRLRESLDSRAVDANVYALLEALELALGTEEEADRYGRLGAARLRELGRDNNAAVLLGVYARLTQYCRERGDQRCVQLLSARASLLGGPSR